jgi:ribosomal protein L11 methylase PrmA
MEYYEKAIIQAVKGKTIIDAGAGTGILSMIAAKAGA